MSKEMSLPEELVALTGITLQDLASYIHVNPSNLTRFINGSRTLPANALIEMAEMFTTIHGQPLPDPPPLSPEERKELQQMAENCAIKRKKLEKQLTEVQQQYAQGQRMLQLVSELATKPENSTERQQRWLEEQQYRAEVRMAANSLVLQKKLTVTIDLLQQEEAAYLAV